MKSSSSLNQKRPKLIGNNRSRFVQFIKRNLTDVTLGHRFSPLIYFWGTNPQTALFGYLQGQSSVKEVPRESFTRQFLYVSDAQYLHSNVDLSEHYEHRAQRFKSQALVQLQVDQLLEETQRQQQHQQGSMLNENIRFVLDDMMRAKSKSSALPCAASKSRQTKRERAAPNEKRELEDLSSGSSSDSGVFANDSSASQRSSASSLSDVTIIDNLPPQDKCNCRTPYEGQLLENAHIFTQDANQRNEQQIFSERSEFGQCALDWYRESHKHYHENKLVALISAGMTTGSDKKYVTDTVRTLTQLGYEVCVFIRRGVGGLKLSSTRFFSPAKWRDFEAAVRSVRQQRPNARLVAIGFSFGSIELCRYLSMSGKGSLVHAAFLISCPFDPEAGGRNMRKHALNRKVDAYLAKNLGKQLYRAFNERPAETDGNRGGSVSQQEHSLEPINTLLCNYNGSLVNLATLPKIRSLVDFETNYNRILQHYPNREAYAADSRLQNHLICIETPTLCLNSEDDFMAPMKLLPVEQIQANKNLCMILTKRGGHMAFIDGLFWPKKPYFAQRLIQKYMGAVKESLMRDENVAQIKSLKDHNHDQIFHSLAKESSDLNLTLTNNSDQHARSDHLLQMFDEK